MEIIEKIKSINIRPDWNSYFMSIAYLISKRSSCDRLHVGCVIVNDNHLIAAGYNAHITAAPHTSIIIDDHEQMTIHAEMNAIADAASRGIKLNGSKAYITNFPCVNCAKILIAAGIKEIIYGEDYKNDEICYKLYSLANMKITKYQEIKND